MRKKSICFLISLCMIFTMIPGVTFANATETPVAVIGEIEFDSLQDAVDSVEDGETVVLLKDWGQPLEIGDDYAADFTLDLNGNEIYVSNAIDAVSVYDGNVTIKNGIIKNNYYVDGNEELTEPDYLEDFTTCVYAGGQLILDAVTMTCFDAYSSTCYVEDDADVVIRNSTLSNIGRYGECISISDYGNAVITNCVITGYESDEASAFVEKQSGITVYGTAVIEDTTIKDVENGIYVESSNPVSVKSCKVSNTDSAIVSFDSSDVSINKGYYGALNYTLYSDNSNIRLGGSEWYSELSEAFYGESDVTLMKGVSPSVANWDDKHWVKFYTSLVKPQIAGSGSYGAKAARIKWKSVEGAAKYEIYRSTKQTTGFKKIKTVTATTGKDNYSYIDNGRTRYKTYYYKVKAVGHNSTVSSLSTYKKIKVNIAAPKLTVACTRGDWIDYKWNEVPGANGYQFYYKIGKNGKWKLADTITNQDYQMSIGFDFGKTYYLKMRAYDKVDGKKYYSAYSNVVKYYHKPAAINNLKVSKSSGKAKLTWDKDYKISGYEIYRSTSKNGTYSKIKTIKGASTKTYTDKTVKKGKTYYYKVRSYAKVNGKNVYGKFSTKVKITL